MKVGVQTKGILPEMGLEEGVALIANAGFESVDFNLDTFLKNSDVYAGRINKFFDADLESLLAYFGEYKKAFEAHGIRPSQLPNVLWCVIICTTTPPRRSSSIRA